MNAPTLGAKILALAGAGRRQEQPQDTGRCGGVVGRVARPKHDQRDIVHAWWQCTGVTKVGHGEERAVRFHNWELPTSDDNELAQASVAKAEVAPHAQIPSIGLGRVYTYVAGIIIPDEVPEDKSGDRHNQGLTAGRVVDDDDVDIQP